ncbi:MAG TPA: 2Fe-2S iron-sulfur cluster-binding protein [Steroidobacteraceae bacterium]|nr:2Fe-2S iron-sulfur cluster-binding protein [Steroidobacteraceae bacterium]
MKFYALPVLSVEPAAQDATSIRLDVAEGLRQELAHKAGQYVSVRCPVHGLMESRTYSIVTAPGEKGLRLGVRAQPGGRASQLLAKQLRPGDLLEVSKPMGRFWTPREASRRRSYVAFAAGSGITPVLSIAGDILKHEPQSRFTLVYGNRNTARTMFAEEILELKNRFVERFSVHFVMSREPQQAQLLNGRLEAEKVTQLLAQFPDIGSADEYFICGPEGMTEDVRRVLASTRPHATIRIERFAAGAGAHRAVSQPTTVAPPLAVLATVGITLDGRRREFPMSPQDPSVLDAAERAGLRLPFSCRAGICATCRVKVLSGQAAMAHNIALASWETELGYILSCQARPLTPHLELSYDQK